MSSVKNWTAVALLIAVFAVLAILFSISPTMAVSQDETDLVSLTEPVAERRPAVSESSDPMLRDPLAPIDEPDLVNQLVPVKKPMPVDPFTPTADSPVPPADAAMREILDSDLLDNLILYNGDAAVAVPRAGANAGSAGQGDNARSDSQLLLFRLKYAAVTPAHHLLGQLFPDVTLAVDLRTNTLFALAAPSRLAEIQHAVDQIDQPAPLDSSAPFGPVPSQQHSESNAPYSLNRFASHTGGPAALPVPTSNGSLKPAPDQLSDAGSAAQIDEQLREQLRDTLEDLGSFTQGANRSHLQPAIPNGLKSRLKAQVAAAFDARQQFQRAELVLLREQVARIEQSIAARDRLKERIVNERVNELLSATALPLGQPGQSESAFGTPLSVTTERRPTRLAGVIISREANQTVQLSLGADDGLRANNRLQVFHEGRMIGTLTVVSVQPDRSVARIDSESESIPIESGFDVMRLLSRQPGLTVDE